MQIAIYLQQRWTCKLFQTVTSCPILMQYSKVRANISNEMRISLSKVSKEAIRGLCLFANRRMPRRRGLLHLHREEGAGKGLPELLLWPLWRRKNRSRAHPTHQQKLLPEQHALGEGRPLYQQLKVAFSLEIFPFPFWACSASLLAHL